MSPTLVAGMFTSGICGGACVWSKYGKLRRGSWLELAQLNGAHVPEKVLRWVWHEHFHPQHQPGLVTYLHLISPTLTSPAHDVLPCLTSFMFTKQD